MAAHRSQPRVVVVGAGPAGVRCAEALVEAGLRPVVIDENRRDGGQIYRRQPEGFNRDYATLYGRQAASAKALHATFDCLRERLDYRPECLAWGLADDVLHCVRQGRAERVPFDALLLCTGATDRLMPLPGWHLAGCYSLGGAQIALKAQAVSIGRRVVFAGSGPLLYLVASQYLKAGADVAALLDTSSLSQRLKAMPRLAARPGVLIDGMLMTARLRASGVALHSGVELETIEGDAEHGVSAIAFRDGRGHSRRIECDAVGLGYHLRPETQLADFAGCRFSFDSQSRQWLVESDEDGATTVDNVFVAGDGGRLRGADAAELAGRLAALAALARLGIAVDEGERTRLRQALEPQERFRQGLTQAFPWPGMRCAELPDATIVCRCEGITAGELRATVNAKGTSEVNRTKAFSRLGMGRCQGRYCGHAGAEIIAAASGHAIAEVGRLRGQAPVKPLAIATLPEETP